MRVCLFTDSFLPYISGVSSAVFNQANELSRRGHSVSIFHPRPSRHDSFETVPGLDRGVSVHGLPFSVPTFNIPKLRFSVPLFLYTYRRLRQAPPDLIHVHTEFGCGLEGMLLGRWKKVPVIGTFHTFFAEPTYLKQFHIPNFEFTRKAMWKYSVGFFNRCSHIVSPSQSVRDHLVARGLEREATVLSNGIERIRIRPEREIAGFRKSLGIEDFAFIYIGRVSPEKSLDVALEAFKQVLEVNPKAKFVLVGNGPSDSAVDAQIRQLGIQDAVVRTGRIERDRLMSENYPLLGDAFVTASKTENQPVSILEAMVFGLPLIGPRAKGIPELIEHGRNGLIFNPDDVYNMASAMVRLMKDQQLHQRMRQASLDIAATHDIEHVGDRLEAIYHRAIAESRARLAPPVVS
ncbi:glycosyltransferase [Pelagicoccus sp. SDUM812003]|uniref:glycosyltransferase n=1 Tax=Pelagicoccus sp. SDUM812003 TaxID=3041267 RepID=UPI00280F1830|nr:glycosyltransferase [Pelagicoccus sp. SDUM812003]MDQ8201730.1 glycosyltransferase [Pelagicoccus sp. SDUM812003]